MWTLYGTAYRSAYTVYEVTFAGPVECACTSPAFVTPDSGNWPTNARPVLNKVSQFYSIFFVVYVTIIVFALIRIISAIFLKEKLRFRPIRSGTEGVVVVSTALHPSHAWPGLPVRTTNCTDFDVGYCLR